MPDASSSPRRHRPVVLFEAPAGDALAARERARALLTPPPPHDLAGIATLMVTAALLHAALSSGDRVTKPDLHSALKALLRGPGKDWHESPMILVSYAAAERRDLPDAQLLCLAAWLEEHLGVSVQVRTRGRRLARRRDRSQTHTGPLSA